MLCAYTWIYTKKELIRMQKYIILLMGKKCSLKMRKNTEFMLPLRNDFIINVSP